MELRPAHETMLDQIKHHCNQIEILDKFIAEGLPPHAKPSSNIYPGSFEGGRTSEIGGLCSLLETLEKTFIPMDKLDEVIAGLAGIKYRHAAISVTVRSLERRKAQSGLPEENRSAA